MMRRLTLAVVVASTLQAQDTTRYTVDAVQYATIPFRVSGLIAGADTSRRLEISMAVWLVRGGGRNILIDAGFHRQRFVERWKPNDFVTPAEAVRRAGVAPEQITDIVVTHVHWDHADGIDLFRNARVWIQEDEYSYYVTPTGTVKERGIEPEVATMLHDLESQGRLRLIAGDAKEFLPGITAYTGGRHTFQSQYVGVRTAAGTVVIASDNLYLYENLDRRAPIAQTFDSTANLRAQDRMRTIASDVRLIVPGHDPAVFQRFARPGERVARIK
ncbi:MAG TPA: N-acyl homoserine lactonase family protein [Gemmatimonadaceae bacterium]|nr:N-acyl homoserine lactonase family protein [Gemmatimonadaceae bacterium]